MRVKVLFTGRVSVSASTDDAGNVKIKAPKVVLDDGLDEIWGEGPTVVGIRSLGGGGGGGGAGSSKPSSTAAKQTEGNGQDNSSCRRSRVRMASDPSR